MLEIVSHQLLKKFIKTHHTDWNHIYSFGRIISKCLNKNETYLVNSEIFASNIWISPILISLIYIIRITYKIEKNINIV